MTQRCCRDHKMSLFSKRFRQMARRATPPEATMGVDLDDEVPIVGTELYDTDFDAFVEVRRRVPRPCCVPRCPEPSSLFPSPQISRRTSSRAKTDQPRPFLVPFASLRRCYARQGPRCGVREVRVRDSAEPRRERRAHPAQPGVQ
mgnify:CR=1 FL=1